MKKMLVALVVAGMLTACASPAADYVRADATTWAQFDPYIDRWIDTDTSISPEKKDALHQLNAARRARVSHAIASVGS